MTIVLQLNRNADGNATRVYKVKTRGVCTPLAPRNPRYSIPHPLVRSSIQLLPGPQTKAGELPIKMRDITCARAFIINFSLELTEK